MNDPRSDWKRAIQVALRGWWLILLLGLATGGTAFALSSLDPPDARVTGSVIVAPTSTLEANYSLSDTLRLLTQPGILGTLAEVLESPRTVELAGDELGLDPTQLEDYEVTAEEVAGATVIEIHVDGPVAEQAERLADGVVGQATLLFNELYPLYEVRSLDSVRPAPSPAASPIQLTVVGFVVGAALAVLLLLGWARLRESMRARPSRDAETDDSSLFWPSSGRQEADPPPTRLAGRP